MQYPDLLFKCCYTTTVTHYLRTYICCFSLFMLLVYFYKSSSDLLMTLWLISIVSLSILRAYFSRVRRIRAIDNYSEIIPTVIRLQNRIEFLMLEFENMPLDILSGSQAQRNQIPHANKELIETLPHVQANEPGNCCICIDDIYCQDAITILPCTHKFHSACVDNWLLIKASCPVCKSRIIS